MQKIKKGDIVDIVAPAGFSNPEVLIKAVDELTKWGLVCRSNIDFTAFHPYHSDDDQNRLDDLVKALNGDAKIIWCLRGGYGTARLLDKLSKIKKPKTEKIIIGYSDITSILNFVNKKWGWKAVHGPTISTFSNKNFNKKDISELKDILFKKQKKFSMELFPINLIADNQKKSIEAELVGGNLAIIQTLIGTKHAIETKNKILFLEDVNEKGYQVDRMLNHLEMTGAFKYVKAIIFGDFTGGTEVSGENYVDFAIARFALDHKIPIYGAEEFGHDKRNRALIVGSKYKIHKNHLISKF